MKKPENDRIEIPEYIPTFNKVGGLNTSREDYNLLKNKPSSSGGSYFCMDIWSSAGSTGDATYRDINLIGSNGDMETTYSQEIIVARGSTTAKITKKYNCAVVGNEITVPAGATVNIVSNYSSATQFGRIIKTGGSIRYIQGSSLDISNTNNNITFINSSTSSSSIKIQFGTSGTDRPIFGISIQILL